MMLHNLFYITLHYWDFLIDNSLSVSLHVHNKMSIDLSIPHHTLHLHAPCISESLLCFLAVAEWSWVVSATRADRLDRLIDRLSNVDVLLTTVSGMTWHAGLIQVDDSISYMKCDWRHKINNYHSSWLPTRNHPRTRLSSETSTRTREMSFQQLTK